MRRTACFSLLFLGMTLHAGLNHWTAIGPAGGNVWAIIVDPAHGQTLYAVVSGAVYKSEDGAASWRRLDLADQVGLLAIPASTGTLYAASTQKVWMSSDGGEHWRNVTPPGPTILGLAATADHAILLMMDNVYVFDGRDTWESVDQDPYEHPEGLPGIGYDRLAASQGGEVIVWRARDPSGLKFITADGFNWRSVQKSGEIVDFGEDGALYVTDEWTQSDGALIVHKSIDAGQTWTDVALACDQCPVAPAWISRLHVAANERMFISKLLQDGRWFLEEYDSARLVTTQEMTGSPAGAITSDRDSGRIFAGTFIHGVLALEGETWIASNKGLPGMPLSDIAVAPLDSSLLYAASAAGALRSTDAGKTWETLETRGNHVAVDPNASNAVYVTGVSCPPYECPNTARLPLYVGLKKSSDSGRTWSVVRPELSYAAAVAPSDSEIVYATLADGMARSSDGGATWNSINDGITFDADEMYYSQFYASTPLIDPHDASAAYIARPDGLYRTQGGATWSRVFAGAWVPTMAIDPSGSNRMYRGGKDGMSISDDGGVTWRASGLADEIVTALAISPAEPHSIYAGTESGAVYLSDDRAETWQRFDDGLPHSGVTALSVDASGRFLVAATAGGVYGYESGTEVVPRAEDLRLDDASVVIPIVGSTRGANATRWSSDVTIRNNASSDQDVVIAWLPQSDVDVSFFNVKVPAGRQVDVPNIVDKLDATGTGSILLFGTSLEAAARICSHRDDRSPICESILGVPSAGLENRAAMNVAGLRHDAQFRTSVGIVNLDASWRAFHVTIAGERQSGSIDVFVPPNRSSRTSLNGDFGALTVDVTAIGPPSRWLAYGSMVDNVSDAGTTIMGTRR